MEDEAATYRRLLSDACVEIKSLRHSNELMRARLEMFDSVMTTLRTQPAHKSEGYAPCIVHEIERKLRESKNENTQKHDG